MITKKRSFKSFEDFYSKPSVGNDLDISWSSSSSEKDNSPKKFKSNHHSESNFKLVNAWMKRNHSPSKSIDSISDDDNYLNICSQFTCTTNDDEYDDKPSIKSNHTFEESPIIGNLRLGEVSPVLGSKEHKLTEILQCSPVIGTRKTSVVFRRRLSKVRKIVKDDQIHELGPKLFKPNSIEETEAIITSNSSECSEIANLTRFKSISKDFKLQSDVDIESISSTPLEVSILNKLPHTDVVQQQNKPKLFYVDSNEKSVVIIENNSPSNSQKTDFSIGSEKSYNQSLNYSIDPFLTQECSEITPNTDLIESPTSQEVFCDLDPPNKSSFESETSSEMKIITESTETSSTKSSGVEPLYHEVLPKKKKRYKKDGLAEQLQKALHKQKTDFAIWRHELYLKKSKVEVSNLLDEIPVLMLKIVKFWKEFGVTIVECEVIKEENQELLRSVNNSNVNSNKCLVIIGFNVTHNLRIKINAKFKLSVPYKIKIVKYNDESLFCYFNVSKLLSFK